MLLNYAASLRSSAVQSGFGGACRNLEKALAHDLRSS